MSILGLLMLLSFMATQGAAVFGTAYIGLRFLKTSRRLAKFAAMSASYTAWVALTIAGYALLGGDGGLMDGFGLVLSLCLTALVSSLVYLVIWTFSQPAERPAI